jgi:hypothetical protein
MLSDPDVRTAKMAEPTRMGWRRRQMALIATLAGLATFVIPSVWTDSEILGRTRWSPLQVILAVQAGTLPVDHRTPQVTAVFLGIDFFMGVGVVYCLLGLVAAAIVFLPSARFVGTAASIGAAVVLGEAQFEYQDLQEAIYGAPRSFASGHQVHAGADCLILLGVLGMLIWIAATKELD